MKKKLRSSLHSAVTFCLLSGAWGVSAQAKVPSNCAVESTKLRELAKSAHHLPAGFDENIFGSWSQNKGVAKVNVDVTKDKRGYFRVGVKVTGLVNFSDRQPLMICTTNKPYFEVRANLDGKPQVVEVAVQSSRKINILEGRLAGLYQKIKDFR
jgi:hypothetical protein